MSKVTFITMVEWEAKETGEVILSLFDTSSLIKFLVNEPYSRILWFKEF